MEQTATETTLAGYLDALASEAPTPGGGSAAAVVAAHAAALVSMVCRLTLKNAKLEASHGPAEGLLREAERLRQRLLANREKDEEAYRAVIAAQSLPKSTPEQKATRTMRLQAALNNAALAPLSTAKGALDALALADRATDLNNPHLVSDAGCAAEFAAAAIRAASFNVRINHQFMKDEGAIRAHEAQLASIEDAGEVHLAHARMALKREGL